MRSFLINGATCYYSRNARREFLLITDDTEIRDSARANDNKSQRDREILRLIHRWVIAKLHSRSLSLSLSSRRQIGL